MPIGAGDILFTANFTGSDSGGSGQELFSFIATTTINAGEIIRFFYGPSYFDFTVGAGGLNPLDRVTISEESNTMTVLVGNGTAGDVSGLWSVSVTLPIIAASVQIFHTPGDDSFVLGHVVAAISNGSASFYATGLGMAQDEIPILEDTAAQAASNPSPILLDIETDSSADDNVMYAGTTLEGIDDFSNWVSTGTNVDYATGAIGGTSFATQDANIMCLLPGTMIAAPDGAAEVTTLRPGDMVMTADCRAVPVKWLGRQTLHTRRMGLQSQPVRIRAGALGGGLPIADLTVTADHGMVLDGYVINASALVNGDTIDWVPMAELGTEFCVYHVETEAHDIILANGAPSETFLDAAGRSGFDNFQDYLDLYGVERVIPEMDRPRITSSRLVPERLRRLLRIEENRKAVLELSRMG